MELTTKEKIATVKIPASGQTTETEILTLNTEFAQAQAYQTAVQTDLIRDLVSQIRTLALQVTGLQTRGAQG